jgi:hypothetical protein
MKLKRNSDFTKNQMRKKINCKNKNQIKRKDKSNGYYEIYEILEGWHKNKKK